MQNIGYIVSKRKIKDLMNGIGVVNDISLITPNMPYLVVGLEEAKKCFTSFNILNKKIDNLGSWTFGKTERRNDYEKDVNGFYRKVINNIINNIKYYYINILSIKYNKVKNMLNLLNSTERKYIYISNGMIYIYMKNYVIGISLQILKYCGIKQERVVEYLKRCKNTTIYTHDAFLSFQIKGLIKDKKYLIPYFMSLQ